MINFSLYVPLWSVSGFASIILIKANLRKWNYWGKWYTPVPKGGVLLLKQKEKTGVNGEETRIEMINISSYVVPLKLLLGLKDWTDENKMKYVDPTLSSVYLFSFLSISRMIALIYFTSQLSQACNRLGCRLYVRGWTKKYYSSAIGRGDLSYYSAMPAPGPTHPESYSWGSRYSQEHHGK